jgi:putative phosphoesterase
MRIGVISDTHDNIWKLEQALEQLQGVDTVIHCGDLCAPFMIKHLGEAIEVPIHIVWGNNEGDQFRISKVAAEYSNVHLRGELAQLEIEGVRIGVHHYPEVAVDLARSGSYDIVCYGHDHTAHEEMIGDCLLLNPGEILGMNGKSTLAIVELPDKQVVWIELE